jgi:Domain of unknown function (DUF4383)
MSSSVTPPQPIAGSTQRSLMQNLAWVYAALFLFVVALGYIPGLTNSAGQLLGLFRIELKDDILHLGSGLWAATAGWLSTRASTFYFKLFGIIYGLDGVLGFLTGQGYLDGGIFIYGVTPLDLTTRFAANLPHMLIGGIAVLIGFVVSRRYAGQQ